MNDNPYESPAERERRQHWARIWKLFAPKDGRPRVPVFHAGCGTLVLTTIVGVPLGMAVARAFFGHNAGPLGATIGWFVMLLVFGYIEQHRPRLRRPGSARNGPGVFRDPVVAISAAAGAALMAFYGARFAPEIGETAAAGAIGLGVIGLIGGFVVGAVVHAVRRKGPRSMPGPDVPRWQR